MVSYPPNFVSKVAEEQWDAGFKAGLQEVLHALKLEDTDAKGSPNEQWIKDFSDKITKKYK
jgi:hypothetical protein